MKTAVKIVLNITVLMFVVVTGALLYEKLYDNFFRYWTPAQAWAMCSLITATYGILIAYLLFWVAEKIMEEDD